MFISTYNAATNGSHIADIEFLTALQIAEYLRGYSDCVYEEDDITQSEMRMVHSIFSDTFVYIPEVAAKNYISL